ncbi:MAG: glycosyltransferase [Magnetococcales bacterium]|nr:glycosyltransferase [Magnetococcales bacterium]
MNKRPLSPIVTLLMPFRNAAATLTDCLDSIRGQSLASFELLAVDDGSEDTSADLIGRAFRGDHRLRLLSPGQVGLVGALNLGLKAAQTPLIARMDADDIMHPQRLEKQVAYLNRHPQSALVACRTSIFPEGSSGEGFRFYMQWQNRCITTQDMADEIYWESPMAHPSVMFRRGVVMQLGGYREGLFPEDYDLWLRMAASGAVMAKLPETLLQWRDGPDRLSRTDPRCSRQAFDKLRAHYLGRDPRLASERPLIIWGAGRNTRKRVKHLLNEGHTPDGWIDIDPNKIGQRIWNAPVHAPAWLDRPHQPRPYVLNYVANHGAREMIERWLASMCYRRGRDFLMVG